MPSRPKMAKSGQIWPKMAKPDFAQPSPPDPVAKNGQKWPKVAKNGQADFWIRSFIRLAARNGQKWPKAAKSGQKWPNMFLRASWQ